MYSKNLFNGTWESAYQKLYVVYLKAYCKKWILEKKNKPSFKNGTELILFTRTPFLAGTQISQYADFWYADGRCDIPR